MNVQSKHKQLRPLQDPSWTSCHHGSLNVGVMK